MIPMQSGHWDARFGLHRFGFGVGAADGGLLDREGRASAIAALQDKSLGADFAGLETSGTIVRALMAYRRLDPVAREAAKTDYQKAARERFAAEMRARLAQASDPTTAFRERMVWFWSNHFTVSFTRGEIVPLIGAFEREAIRPFVAGRFGEMLIAVSRHPAMLLYLDNARSIGPNSMVGQRGRRGLNENLAREILELHTLGVDGGYAQTDVEALSRILTGWSLAGEQPAPDDNLNDGGFGYYANRHDPGPKQLLGVSYQERDGFVEGALALNDLALHPSTARHICRKLATHFISDNPSDDAIEELQAIWIASHGDLKAVSIKLLALQSAGQTALAKMRPPGEYLIACLRLAAGPKAGTIIQGSNMTFLGALRNLGQPLFDAPSPKGWSDQSADWTGPEALMQRVALAHSIAARMPPSGNPEDIAVAALGPLLSDRTRHTIRQAASPSEGLALLLASPEVQKR